MAVLHHRSSGDGPPVVFLHGNPTSSYLWRHVVPGIGGHRLITVDLIGMGDSDKPDIAYRLTDHIAYVEQFFDELGLRDATVVAHDWGCAIALDLSRRRPSLIGRLALLEGHLRPLAGWSTTAVFEPIRKPGVGERMVLDENFLLDSLLPAALPSLSPAELAEYRRPYPDPRSRRPLLQWAREIPVAGDPPDVAALLTSGWAALSGRDIPTLLAYATPGAVVGPDVVRWAADTQPGLATVHLGPGGHFLPEERPHELAAAISRFLGVTDS
jgi:haloalkane dehalogenase